MTRAFTFLVFVFWLVAIPTRSLADWSDYEFQGLLTGERHPTQAAGNSLLFTSAKYVYLKQRGVIVWRDGPTFEQAILPCRIEPGHYRRTPQGAAFSEDEEAQDDYIGLAAASYALNDTQAQEIYDYGLAHDFYYGIHYDLNWANWLGRSPAFLAHLKWAAHLDPSALQKLAWSVAIATAGLLHPDAQDPWILGWLMIQTMDGRSFLPRLAARFWTWRLHRRWGSIEAVYARYFNDANHPLAQLGGYGAVCPAHTELVARTASGGLVCNDESP